MFLVPPVIWTLNKVPSEEKPISFESAGDDDVKWWEAEPITRLNLFGNSIKELPGDGIAQLDSLVNIDVSFFYKIMCLNSLIPSRQDEKIKSIIEN